MEEQRRDELQAKLSDAIERQARLERQLQEHVTNIEQVRAGLGNPFHFHPRPNDHSESRAKYI